MPRSIERVLAHLILPSLSKSEGLLSSRQATVQPNDNSIGSLNVKDKSQGALSSIPVESELEGAPVHKVLSDAWIPLPAGSSLGPARCARRYDIQGSGSNSGANV